MVNVVYDQQTTEILQQVYRGSDSRSLTYKKETDVAKPNSIRQDFFNLTKKIKLRFSTSLKFLKKGFHLCS